MFPNIPQLLHRMATFQIVQPAGCTAFNYFVIFYFANFERPLINAMQDLKKITLY